MSELGSHTGDKSLIINDTVNLFREGFFVATLLDGLCRRLTQVCAFIRPEDADGTEASATTSHKLIAPRNHALSVQVVTEHHYH
jgi:hypothetical protein